jgi:pimeloyl-ACP methyl ester carboxylesterase
VVHLADEPRFSLPTLVVCPESTPAQAREWIAARGVAELPRVQHLEFVDIDSGHWPMLTAPAGLARLLAAAATGLRPVAGRTA